MCAWRGLYDVAGTEQGDDDAAAVAAADEAMKEAMDAEGSPMMSPGPEVGVSVRSFSHSFIRSSVQFFIRLSFTSVLFILFICAF